MNTINDIADYIILQIKSDDDSASLINLKLQKLLYYVQAWSYGINGNPLFEGEFEAWIHGPVNREIFDRFKGSKSLYSEIFIQDCINPQVVLLPDEKKFVDYILENYAPLTGAQLETMTHSEDPWRITRGKLGPYDYCDRVIAPELMKAYYASRWTEINRKS